MTSRRYPSIDLRSILLINNKIVLAKAFGEQNTFSDSRGLNIDVFVVLFGNGKRITLANRKRDIEYGLVRSSDRTGTEFELIEIVLVCLT